MSEAGACFLLIAKIIKYRPIKDNATADSLSCAFCASMTTSILTEVYASFCHPGVTRLLLFVRTKNLAFSIQDVRKVCSSCQICAELKPRFYKMEEPTQPYKNYSSV